eukprot:1158402-Pelagomonas_calceolata.AAC.4
MSHDSWIADSSQTGLRNPHRQHASIKRPMILWVSNSPIPAAESHSPVQHSHQLLDIPRSRSKEDCSGRAVAAMASPKPKRLCQKRG